MHKISSKQIFSFAFFLTCFLFPGFGDTFLLQSGKNSTIICCILGVFLGLVTIFMIISIFKQTTNKNLFQLNKERFKFFGTILNTLYIIGFIYIIMVGTWAIINFTVSQFLTRTSYYFVLLVIDALIALAIIKKTEVLGRVSIILIIIFFGIVIFSNIFLIPIVEINNFFPIIDVNKQSIIKTIITYACFSSIPLICLLFIKGNNVVDKEKIGKKIIWGYIIASIMIIIFLSLIIGVFGIDMGVLFTYPEYTLFKKINAFSFIQRVENIIATIIFIASFIGLCLLYSFLKNYIKETFKIEKEKLLQIIIIIFIFLISILSIYIFQNYLVIFLYKKYPFVAILIFIVLFVNFILLFLTKKKLTKKS